MTIPPDLEAQILRYHHVEQWRIGTIARQLRGHPETVARVLAQAGLPRIGAPRPLKIDPSLPFIRAMLARFPRLTASRLYAMACERGYRGGSSRFRAIIAGHRPRPAAAAYLRLRTLPGEQAPCDWAHFGHLVIGRARRPLMAFVMVLSVSRPIFLRFFLGAGMENFPRGHLGAFAAWDGVPRVILYDTLRSAVLARHGEAIRFNPALPRLCVALPLRTASRRGSARQRKRPRGKSPTLRPGWLLRRPHVHRPGRSQCSGRCLVSRPGRRSALSRRPHPQRRPCSPRQGLRMKSLSPADPRGVMTCPRDGEGARHVDRESRAVFRHD